VYEEAWALKSVRTTAATASTKTVARTAERPSSPFITLLP
jgi:hypothetical protein